MSVLSWEKPKKVKSTAEWKDYEADGAPPGVYTPNMSETDMKKWKAKLVGHKVGQPRVEIRKTAGSQILMIVSLTGVKYPDKWKKVGYSDVNVHISANGPIWFTFNELTQLQAAVTEAREKLEKLAKE